MGSRLPSATASACRTTMIVVDVVCACAAGSSARNTANVSSRLMSLSYQAGWLSGFRHTATRIELRRSGASPRRAGNRHVLELFTGSRGAQQESTAAHVTAADERRWKQQPFAEDVQQHIDVLARRDAAEQDDAGLVADLVGQRRRRPFERPAVLDVRGIDV